MSNTNVFLAFAAGAAAGSITTWFLVKSKYEQIAQEEIDSVKEAFSKKATPVETENNAAAKAEPKEEKPGIMEYAALLRERGYIKNTSSTENEKEREAFMEKPYIISPEEFGEFDDYEKISLTYYSKDEILTDENDEIVDDVDDIVGIEALNHFGEYEEDSVFVRNDRLKCDYEILLDLDSYPRRAEAR